MDPVVCVQVGDQKKYTSVKESTNCPYYNEVSDCLCVVVAQRKPFFFSNSKLIKLDIILT